MRVPEKPKTKPRYLALGLSTGLFLVLCATFYAYTVDDAYICLRYARNLTNNFGLVFSTDGSPPVEGYTNFLWILLEALPFLLGLPEGMILHAVKTIGILFGLGTVILTYRFTQFLTEDKNAGSLAALFVACVPHLAFWSVGGLETSMYIFWLTAGLLRYFMEEREEKAHVGSAVCFTLMAFTRPEGLFFALVIFLWDSATALLGRRTASNSPRWHIAPGLAVFALCYGAYFAWRWSYYGFPFPNTYYARSGLISIEQITSRFQEMRPFFLYLAPLVVVALAGSTWLSLPRRREKSLLILVFAMLVLFSFASRREWMPGFRYELPFVPILVSLFSASISRLLFRPCADLKKRQRGSLIGAAILLCVVLYLAYPGIELRRATTYTDSLNRCHVTLGKWLGKHVPAEGSYAGWDMGAIPYYSRMARIIDIHPEGILSTHTAHVGYDVDYLLSVKPSFIILPPLPQGSSRGGMFGFHLRKEFRDNYELLFSFVFDRHYILDVYKRMTVYVSERAIEEGTRLARRTHARHGRTYNLLRGFGKHEEKGSSASEGGPITREIGALVAKIRVALVESFSYNKSYSGKELNGALCNKGWNL
jgi:hypothetical protein